MRDELLQRVEETVVRYRLIGEGDRVLAGVSGGADSVCMLDILNRLRERFGFSLCVGHVNHLMREEAADDAAYVESLARGYGLDVETVAVDMQALAKKQRLSIEDAARQGRYQALEEMAARMGAGSIAVAHTADDQVETIVLNFLRGGGPEGLAGMRVSRPFLGGGAGLIIRPIIDLTKAETEAYCREQALETRLDVTNLDMSARRNRLRRHVLPLLKEEQPALAAVLLRQAEIFRVEDEYLRELADAARFDVQLSESSDEIALSIEKLASLPHPIRRRVIREILRTLRIGRLPLSVEQIDRVLALAQEGGTGKALDLGEGLKAEKEYEKLILSRKADKGIRGQGSGVREKILQIPGSVESPEIGKRIAAEKLKREEIQNLRNNEGGSIAYLDAAKIAPAEMLTVRLPQPGDRFVPLGSHGSMKLQDFFVNEKIVKRERTKIALVCHNKAIVWVAGLRIDDRYKVTEETQEIVRLRIQELQG